MRGQVGSYRPVMLGLTALALVVAACTSGETQDTAVGQPTTPTPIVATTNEPATTAPSPSSGDGPPATTAPGPESNPFCEELVRIEADARASGERIANAPDFFTGLIVSIAAIGDLRTFSLRLSAVAPPEIAIDLEAIADAQDLDIGGALSNPVVAIANAIFGGSAVGGSYIRVDEYAERECGRAVFGDVTLVLGDDPLNRFPRIDGDMRFFRASNFYGEQLCEVRSTEAVDSGVLTVVCGLHLYGFDANSLSMIWHVELDGPPIVESTTNAGLIATLREDVKPPSGLNPPTWMASVAVFDVATGELLFEVPLNGDGGVAPIGNEEVGEGSFLLGLAGISDSETIHIQYVDRGLLAPESWNGRATLALDRSGSLLYLNTGELIVDMPPGATYAFAVADEGDLRDPHFIDLATGARIVDIPRSVSRLSPADQCTQSYTLGDEGGQVWFFDPDLVEFFTIPDDLLEGRVGDYYAVASGILLVGRNGIGLADRAGNLVWSISGDVIPNPQVGRSIFWGHGHLVVMNKGSELIRVNIRDGSDAGLWSFEEPPPISPDDDEWDLRQSTRGDTILEPHPPVGPCGDYS